MNLNTLIPEDIDEKIKLNQDDGIDIHKLQVEIKKELKDFRWSEIRARVQCQSYEEQLEHIAKRIEQLKNSPDENPYKFSDYKERLAKLGA